MKAVIGFSATNLKPKTVLATLPLPPERKQLQEKWPTIIIDVK
jgi:hypothetical protein